MFSIRAGRERRATSQSDGPINYECALRHLGDGAR
jgi:hypothetical protein